MEAAETQLKTLTDEGVATPQQFPPIPLLEQTTVLAEREGGLTECYVPAELIDHEEVPVKEEWASSIAKQMQEVAQEKGGTGQKTPIRLGWIEGENKFRIIDGFHRDAALMLNGATSVYATVEKTTWDELYDDRIFTAKDHAHVRFSRVVKWIQEVWEYSGLSDHLSVEQAILLYRYDGTGSKLGLAPDIVDDAKSWVGRKEQQWDTQAMTIHSYLVSAERVDPVLVNATREKRSGHALEAPTQQIIKLFSEHLPNEFEVQNLVWETAKAHNLRGPQVKALSLLVQGKDKDEAQEIIAATDVADIEPAYSETQGRRLRRGADPRHKGATALKAATLEIERVNQRVQISLDKDEEVTDAMVGNLDEALSRAETLRQKLGELIVNLDKLKDREKSKAPVLAEVAPMQSVEKAYGRHVNATFRNARMEPRMRNRRIVMDLPTFGRFTGEDWSSLEPHIKFALALDHKDIGLRKEFKSRAEFWSQVIETAQLAQGHELPSSGTQLAEVIKPFIVMLTSRAPRKVGPIIKLDPGSGKAMLTENGSTYLADVVKNTLIEVDESR